MSISLSRIPRFAGNGRKWFPVLLHCFVVSDLLPAHLKAHALVHDGSETVGNDVPKPFKQPWTSHLEDRITIRIWKSLGLPKLSQRDRAKLKAADIAALHGEAWVAGPPHYRKRFPKRYPEAERLVKYYQRRYPARVCIPKNGDAPREFIKRFRLYLKLALR
jgi:hypothetical protein